MTENAVPVLEQQLDEFMVCPAQTARSSSPSKFREIRINGTDVQGDPFSTLDNSTEQSEIYDELIQKVTRVLKAAENEYFENGMQSELSRQLTALVSDYGRRVIVEIAFHINHKLVDEEVIAEVLYSLGKMVDVSSYDFRMALLELRIWSKTSSRFHVHSGTAR
jgi:hypothetical protein